MNKLNKSKWKCKVCAQMLSSKQKVEEHIRSLHPDSNLVNSTDMYVRVQVSKKPEKKDSRSSKPAAYSSFSGLYSLFSDKDICRRFELYSSSKLSSNEIVFSDSSNDGVPTEQLADPQLSDSNTIPMSMELKAAESTPSTSSATLKFTPPFKVRGNCGCLGCLAVPCGKCHFCLNKGAK